MFPAEALAAAVDSRSSLFGVDTGLTLHSLATNFVRKSIIALAIILVSAPCYAQYKCKLTDGAINFQDTPCPSGQKSEKLSIQIQPSQPTSERPIEVRQAMAARRAVIGMTRGELERSIGPPSKINAAQYGAESKDQLIYYTDDRTIYIYTTDGVVTAIENTAGGAPKVYSTPPAPLKSCPSKKDIWEIEIEINKLQNRGNERLQVELYKQLREAKACGQ